MMKRFALFLLLAALALPRSGFCVVSTATSQITVGATGSSYQYAYPFITDAPSDITLILTSATGVQTTIPQSQYLVAPNLVLPGNIWSAGGIVTYPLSGPALAVGNKLTIMRVLPLLQTTALSNQGNFYPAAVESALDTGVMQGQQISARTGSIRGTWLTSTYYNYGDIIQDGTNGGNTGNLYSCAIPNTSGTWLTDLASGDWSLALNVQGIVNSSPQINNNSVLGNISGVPTTAYGVSGTAFFDNAFGNTQGDILYRSGSAWSVLPPGTSGQVLKTNGSGANPQWASSASGGSVTSVATGTGLTGGPITTSGTISVAPIASHSLLANTTTGTAAPSATTVSSLLDIVFGATQGAVLYRGGTTWNELAPGASGQVLTTGGVAANPQWTNAGQSVFPFSSGVTQGSSGNTYYMGLGSLTAGGNGTPISPLAGVASGMTIFLNTSPGSGNSVVATVSGLGTSNETCTIANSAQSCTDSTHTDAVSSGNSIGIQLVWGSGAASSYAAGGIAFSP